MKKIIRNLHARDGSRWQFIRFLVVGLFNTALGYLLFAAGCLIGLKTSFALALAYCLGVLCNFFTTGLFVFRTARVAFLLRFLLLYGTIYAINLALIYLLMQNGVEKLVAQAILVPFMALLSFGGLKYFAFKGV